MTATYRRVPFAPESLDDVVAFCTRHRLCDFDDALMRRLLLVATSGPDGVLAYADGAGPALAAVVVDVPENGAGAASLELLGGRSPVPRELMELLLPDAIAFARAGVRASLQIGVPPALDGASTGDALAAHGFARAFESCIMRRPASAAPPPRPPRPGWRWSGLEQPLIAPLHAALREMFAGSPTLNLSPLSMFGRSAPALSPGWRVLVDGDRVAGAVSLVAHATHGELRTLGRAPAYRGQGLGDHLLTEALRILTADRPVEIRLATELDNTPAVRLYHRFGFEIAERTPWWRLALTR
jgi:ribosomal protein S18 acetylase RimI-like enzyme